MGRTDIKYNVEIDDIELSTQRASSNVVSVPATWHNSTSSIMGVDFDCRIDVSNMTDEQIMSGLIVDIPYKNSDELCKICYYKNGSPYSPSSLGYYITPKISVCGGTQEYLHPCRLKIVNPDEHYLVRLTTTGGATAMITSADMSDLTIRQVVYQDAFLIMKCAPGNMHRYPLTGAKISDMVGNSSDYATIAERIQSELSNDGIAVESLSIDPETGKLEIVVK